MATTRGKQQEAQRPVSTFPRPVGETVLLYTVVIVCGAVLMAFEIVGSRILSPYFGNSIFVWGSLISIVLAALSLGYYLGGLIADRRPTFPTLGVLLTLPGVMIFVLPFLYPALNQAIADLDLGARGSPLAASLVLFLVPSVFLGTVSPFAVRLQASTVATVGSTAGTLYALSTVGSIAGTLLTAFLFIAVLGVRTITHALGATLLLLALALFLAARRLYAALLVGSLSLLLILVVVWRDRTAGAEKGVVWEKDSFYHRITIREDGIARYMDFDNLRQSGISLTDPHDLLLLYSRYMVLGMAFRPEAKTVLFIGLGGGSIPKRIHKDFPELTVDAVEIDPAVHAAAVRFFGVREDERLRVHVQDGRLFVRAARRPYDIAFLDAYNSDTIPFHMVTAEFYRELLERLSPRGVVVANVIGAVSGRFSALPRAVYKTLRAVFPQVYVFPVIRGGVVPRDFPSNIIFVATRDPDRLTRGQVQQRVLALQGKLLAPSEALAYASALWDGPLPTGDVPLLSDDFAPVDLLLAL